MGSGDGSRESRWNWITGIPVRRVVASINIACSSIIIKSRALGTTRGATTKRLSYARKKIVHRRFHYQIPNPINCQLTMVYDALEEAELLHSPFLPLLPVE